MLYREVELDVLQSMAMRVINARAQWLDKPGYRQGNYHQRGEGEERQCFQIYQGQNLNSEQDFSYGIVYLPNQYKKPTLARYNGSGHGHGDIRHCSHIH